MAGRCPCRSLTATTRIGSSRSGRWERPEYCSQREVPRDQAFFGPRDGRRAGRPGESASEQPTLEILGYVVPIRTVAVTSAVAGRVTKVCRCARATASRRAKCWPNWTIAWPSSTCCVEAKLKKAEANLKNVAVGAAAEDVAQARARVQEVEATQRLREDMLARPRPTRPGSAATEKAFRDAEIAVAEAEGSTGAATGRTRQTAGPAATGVGRGGPV